MRLKNKHFVVQIDECSFFSEPNDKYCNIIIEHNGGTAFTGVGLVEDKKEKVAKEILKSLEYYKNLPFVSNLPRLLKRLVMSQYNSETGTIYYDNDGHFPFSDEEVEEIISQITEYRLEKWIKVNLQALDGEAIICCDSGLCTNFNFCM